eukprot:30975-Pelagococcus_subviridis.AAC.2
MKSGSSTCTARARASPATPRTRISHSRPHGNVASCASVGECAMVQWSAWTIHPRACSPPSSPPRSRVQSRRRHRETSSRRNAR